jgi:nucleoid-associated protein YgaU
MPEPVVIIGPAAGPAGPNSGQPAAVETAAAPQADTAVSGEGAGKPGGRMAVALVVIARISGMIFSLAKRAVWAFAALLMHVIRRYPRHSLAAAASILILGGIIYSQSGSKSGRRGVTNAISGNSTPPGGDELKSAQSEPVAKVADDPKVAVEPKAGEGLERKNPATSDPASPPKSDKTETAIAQNDASSAPPLPAPKAEGVQQPLAPGNELAQAGAPDKDQPKPAAAPLPAVSGSDPVVAPLPAPVGDAAKATLLAAPSSALEPGGTPPAAPSSAGGEKKDGEVAANAPSPADKPELPPGVAPARAPTGSGEQVAGANPMPEVPADLFLPDGAPKTGEDKPKEPATGQTTPAAIASGESKPVEEPKKIDSPLPERIEPAGKPAVEPAEKPGVEPVQSPGGSTETPPANTRNNTEPAALPAASNTVQGAVQESVAASKAPEHSQTDGKIIARGGATEASPTKQPAKDAQADGWVSIPNSGGVPVDPTEKAAGEAGDAGSENGSGRRSAGADSRFHAARNLDFEPEPGASSGLAAGAAGAAGGARGAEAAAARAPQARAASHSERVEANEHVVERKENYWTISRQYWGSGRYFVALWKANAANHPDINVLHVGDVIVVPAIEDLNLDYIVPEGKTATTEWLAGLGITLKGSRSAKVSDQTDSTEAQETGTAGAASRSGRVPARRASMSDDELDPPGSETATRGDRSTSYKGRSAAAAKVFDGDGAGGEPTVRTAARPRASGAAGGKPVYRVRTYDTLRSIARDTLGDARRADEILELNRGLIDDPTQLVAGQVLELPEDARTTIRRRASSR